jgi:hypothetical protein
MPLRTIHEPGLVLKNTTRRKGDEMNSKQDGRSHLFLVRFWSDGEQEARDQKDWRGRVQHIVSGEARTFDDWPTLIDLLLEMAETDGTEAKASRARTKEAIQ